MVKRRTKKRSPSRRAKAARSRYQFHGPGRKRAAKASASPAQRRRARKRAVLRTLKAVGSDAARLLILAVFVVIFVGVILFARLVEGLPDTSTLFIHDHAPAFTVLDASGAKIGTRGLSHGEFVPLAQMPRYLPLAVLAVEDRRFYSHGGLDLAGMARAAVINMKAQHIVQGGSTISQQLAKLLFLSPERTYARKFEEALLALWLEHKLTKDQILETYLSRAYLGAGTYGVEAAAQRYFGKSARDVSLVESAMLAGLLKAPSHYAPTASIERAGNRTGLVLDAMVEAGFISKEERARAPQEPAHIVPAAASAGSDYVLDWVIAQIPDFIGTPKDNLIIETTIDLHLERVAEAALSAALDKDGAAHAASEGALLSMTPQGAIVAMVGGRSYADSGFNRAVLARRQPGSAFKPFVYLAALEAGYQPEDMMMDEPIRIGKWQPANYNGRYIGPVTMEDALARSINTVAVTLADEVGRDRVIDVARRFGITSPLEPVPSLALGSQGLGMIELTGAFAGFANGGTGVVPHIIQRIGAKDGRTLWVPQGDGFGEIAAPDRIGTLNQMLIGVVEAGTGTGARVPGQIVAGKTGTSQDLRDAWFVGYSSYFVTSVWVGNDDYSPMKAVTGGTLPAKIFRSFMIEAHRRLPSKLLPGTLEVLPAPLSVAAAPGGVSEVGAGVTGATRPTNDDEDSGLGALLSAIGRVLTGRTNNAP
jgi:penicillin-binding protein 1A